MYYKNINSMQIYHKYIQFDIHKYFYDIGKIYLININCIIITIIQNNDYNK